MWEMLVTWLSLAFNSGLLTVAWQGSSLVKVVPTQVWQLKFKSQNPCKCKGRTGSTNCPLTSASCCSKRAYTYTRTHTQKENLKRVLIMYYSKTNGLEQWRFVDRFVGCVPSRSKLEFVHQPYACCQPCLALVGCRKADFLDSPCL